MCCSEASGSLDLGVNEEDVDERWRLSLNMWGRFGKHCHGVSTVGVIVRIQNFNLGTFLKKISDIFPFVYDLIFFFIQPLSSQRAIQVVYVFHG